MSRRSGRVEDFAMSNDRQDDMEPSTQPLARLRVCGGRQVACTVMLMDGADGDVPAMHNRSPLPLLVKKLTANATVCVFCFYTCCPAKGARGKVPVVQPGDGSITA